MIKTSWQEYKICDVLNNSKNSKPYHFTNLIVDNDCGIPYVTRTSLNNGVNAFIKNANYKTNPKNAISFGAENAQYFFQPYNYVTGNKMYYYDGFDDNTSLFIVGCLNKAIEGCGFGYGMGLTGARSDSRKFMLPHKNNNPDFDYMKNYVANYKKLKINEYKSYIKKELSELETKSVCCLKDKIWKEFFITDIFPEMLRGKRLTKQNQIQGEHPYISSSALNNGVDNFISNEKRVRKFYNCLTLTNSGSVGTAFFHPYEFIASDHVTALKSEKLNKYSYIFIASMLNRLSEKYNFNREINDKRIKREKILLPVNDNNEPDYDYMEQYVKNIIYSKINNYLNFKNK